MLIFFIFSVSFIQSSFVEAVMPEYLPVNRAANRNDAIASYFTLGFTASEILSFLLNVHGIRLSLRQLRRYGLSCPLTELVIYGASHIIKQSTT